MTSFHFIRYILRTVSGTYYVLNIDTQLLFRKGRTKYHEKKTILKFVKLKMTWLGKIGILLTSEPFCLEKKKNS